VAGKKDTLGAGMEKGLATVGRIKLPARRSMSGGVVRLASAASRCIESTRA